MIIVIQVSIPFFFAVVYIATGPEDLTFKILVYFLLFSCCMHRGVAPKDVLADDILSIVEHTVIVLDDS